MAGVATAPGGVPWRPEDAKPLADAFVALGEALMVKKITSKAADVGLPPKTLRELEDDARIEPVMKKALADSGAAVGAKYANKYGLSSEYAPETQLAGLLVYCWRKFSSLESKLDKALAEMKRPEAPPQKP